MTAQIKRIEISDKTREAIAAQLRPLVGVLPPIDARYYSSHLQFPEDVRRYLGQVAADFLCNHPESGEISEALQRSAQLKSTSPIQARQEDAILLLKNLPVGAEGDLALYLIIGLHELFGFPSSRRLHQGAYSGFNHSLSNISTHISGMSPCFHRDEKEVPIITGLYGVAIGPRIIPTIFRFRMSLSSDEVDILCHDMANAWAEDKETKPRDDEIQTKADAFKSLMQQPIWINHPSTTELCPILQTDLSGEIPMDQIDNFLTSVEQDLDTCKYTEYSSDLLADRKECYHYLRKGWMVFTHRESHLIQPGELLLFNDQALMHSTGLDSGEGNPEDVRRHLERHFYQIDKIEEMDLAPWLHPQNPATLEDAKESLRGFKRAMARIKHNNVGGYRRDIGIINVP